jgi:hypothetical protein
MNRSAAPDPMRGHGRHAVAGVVVAIGLILAGCRTTPSSVGGSPAASTTAGSPSAIAYSACMRSHGVPNFPDPNSSGTIAKGSAQQFGVSDSRYQAARTACAHLLPTSGEASQTEIQRAMDGMRSFAQCMRSDGVTNWPDPSTDRAGYPAFYLQGEIDMNAPRIVTKVQACQHLVPTTRVGGGPAGVPMCPGDRPGPDATSTCGGANHGG